MKIIFVFLDSSRLGEWYLPCLVLSEAKMKILAKILAEKWRGNGPPGLSRSYAYAINVEVIMIVTESYYGRETEAKGWLEMKRIRTASAAAAAGAAHICGLGKMSKNCTGALKHLI